MEFGGGLDNNSGRSESSEVMRRNLFLRMDGPAKMISDRLGLRALYPRRGKGKSNKERIEVVLPEGYKVSRLAEGDPIEPFDKKNGIFYIRTQIRQGGSLFVKKDGNDFFDFAIQRIETPDDRGMMLLIKGAGHLKFTDVINPSNLGHRIRERKAMTNPKF